MKAAGKEALGSLKARSDLRPFELAAKGDRSDLVALKTVRKLAA